MYSHKYLTFLFFCLMLSSLLCAQNSPALRMVFWNVENLFDTRNDSLTLDDEFTPSGGMHWNEQRYRNKLNNVYRTIAAMGRTDNGTLEMPAIVAMAEVENNKVLRDLCQGTPLRKSGYKPIHYDSPDVRGIDNAVIYRPDCFRMVASTPICVSDSASHFFTRDILCIVGTLASGDTLILFVNHFPSKRGSEDAERRREHVAATLRRHMDSAALMHPGSAIVVMGDFNAAPDEKAISKTLLGSSLYVNLMSGASPRSGSYNYQGQWSYIDQIIVLRSMVDGSSPLQVSGAQAHVFDAAFLLTDDDRHLGVKPFRTYLGIRYLGGFSDHLPVYVDIAR